MNGVLFPRVTLAMLGCASLAAAQIPMTSPNQMTSGLYGSSVARIPDRGGDFGRMEGADWRKLPPCSLQSLTWWPSSTAIPIPHSYTHCSSSIPDGSEVLRESPHVEAQDRCVNGNDRSIRGADSRLGRERSGSESRPVSRRTS